MHADRVMKWLFIGAAAAAGCAEAAESSPPSARVLAPPAELVAEPAPDRLTMAIATYADTHPCEERRCWLHPRLSGDISGVAGTSESDVWFGMGDRIMHFDGKEVQIHRTGLTRMTGLIRLLRTWAAAPDDVWAISGTSIAHWDGKSFSLVKDGIADGYRSVWGTGRDDVYVVGHGSLIHWNGSSWTENEQVKGLYIAGSAADDVWVGYWELAHFDGRSWSHLPLPKHIGAPISSLSVSGPDDLWMVTDNRGLYLWHFDGTDWVQHVLGTGVRLDGVSALSADDVWAYGQQDGFGPALFHYDGHSWTRGPAMPTRLNEVVRVGGIDYATGAGRIYRIDRTSFGVVTLTPGTTATLTSNWGTSSRDMWAVGEQGTALHYDGARVLPVETGVPHALSNVWGTAPDDVWAVGTSGAVLHWDGAAWTLLPSGTSATLHRVFSRARDDAWIAGDGVLLHASRSGVTLVTPEGVPPSGSFIDIDGVAPDDLWAVGRVGNDGAFVTHCDGKVWSPVQVLRHERYNRQALGIVARGPDDVWIQTPVARDILSQYFWRWDGKTWSFVAPGQSAASLSPPSFSPPWSFAVDGKSWSVGSYGQWSYYREAHNEVMPPQNRLAR